MAYIFMDESGDLGFNFKKKGTSRHFVVTLLFSATKRPIEKVVKKTFKSLPIKVQRKHPGCLHAVKEKPKTRMKLLGLLNMNFKQYLESQIKNNHKLNISIEIKPSHSDKCLQAVDFACWALFRKIEKRDGSYANIIKSKIVEESPLFP